MIVFSRQKYRMLTSRVIDPTTKVAERRTRDWIQWIDLSEPLTDQTPVRMINDHHAYMQTAVILTLLADPPRPSLETLGLGDPSVDSEAPIFGPL